MGPIASSVGRRPLARADGLLVREVGAETVVYDLESKQAHCLKPLAATVFERANGRSTYTDIAELAAYRLGTPVTEVEVADAVAQLEGAGLLQAPLRIQHLPGSTEHQGDGVSRREALRRIGFAGAGAAVATSLVTSIVAPSAAMALSGIPSGCSGCGKNSDCLSNHCCQQVPGKQCNASCCVGANNSCHGTSCTCVGGTNNGQPCNTTTCPGGTCVCGACTVCATDIGNCPSSCPAGTVPCCNPSC